MCPVQTLTVTMVTVSHDQYIAIFYTDLSIMYHKHVHDSVAIAILVVWVSSLGHQQSNTLLLTQTSREGQRVLAEVNMSVKGRNDSSIFHIKISNFDSFNAV